MMPLYNKFKHYEEQNAENSAKITTTLNITCNFSDKCIKQVLLFPTSMSTGTLLHPGGRGGEGEEEAY